MQNFKLITKVLTDDQITTYLHDYVKIYSPLSYLYPYIDIRKPFNRWWDITFDGTYYVLLKLFSEYTNLISDKIVCDYGCNIGTYSFMMKDFNAKCVYGIDKDIVCLSIANSIKHKLNYVNVFFYKGSFTYHFEPYVDVGLLLHHGFKYDNIIDITSNFVENNHPSTLIVNSTMMDQIDYIFKSSYKYKYSFPYFSIYGDDYIEYLDVGK